MASDTAISDATWRACGFPKITRLPSGALLGVAGDVDSRDFVALLSKSTPRRMPSRAALIELKTENEALIVFRTGQIFVVTTGWDDEEHEGMWIVEVIPIRDHFAAIGSGAAYAYGALEAGRSPTDAVRIACRRDSACGLPLQWEGLTP